MGHEGLAIRPPCSWMTGPSLGKRGPSSGQWTEAEGVAHSPSPSGSQLGLKAEFLGIRESRVILQGDREVPGAVRSTTSPISFHLKNTEITVRQGNAHYEGCNMVCRNTKRCQGWCLRTPEDLDSSYNMGVIKYLLWKPEKKIYLCQGNQRNSNVTVPSSRKNLIGKSKLWSEFKSRFAERAKGSFRLQRPMTDSVKLSLWKTLRKLNYHHVLSKLWHEPNHGALAVCYFKRKVDSSATTFRDTGGPQKKRLHYSEPSLNHRLAA